MSISEKVIPRIRYGGKIYQETDLKVDAIFDFTQPFSGNPKLKGVCGDNC